MDIPLFHPLSHPFDVWKELKPNASLNLQAPQEEVVHCVVPMH